MEALKLRHSSHRTRDEGRINLPFKLALKLIAIQVGFAVDSPLDEEPGEEMGSGQRTILLDKLILPDDC
jgi:hypothetical protein